MTDRNLIAILRGVKPTEILAITDALLHAGITKIEVPLNSPTPFDTIGTMIAEFAGRGQFGAGTVLTVADVDRLADLGCQMIISPNCNPQVIKATKARGMLSYPGVMTPSECFAALDAGADGLKFFPGDLLGPKGIKAMRAVLPKDTPVFAVGGAGLSNFDAYFAAGATGFGVGSALYSAGMTAAEVAVRANEMVRAFDAAYDPTA